MNENLNSIEVLSEENQTFYDRTMLEREVPELFLYEDGDKKVVPPGKGTSAEFRKLNSLPVPENSLEEGVTPEGSKLSVTAVVATLKQEGDYVTITDVLDMQGKDPIITETSEMFGEQSAETIDSRIGDIVSAGTTVQYANQKASRDSITNADVLTGAELRKAKRRLKKANIKTFKDKTYHALIDADQEYDFKNDTSGNGFVEVAKYANTKALLDGEIGMFDGIRIRVTSQAKTVDNSNGVTVHKALVYGRHAYGVVDVEKGKGKAKVIVKPIGSAGTTDPLNQRGTIGWKAFFTAVRLNELGICRIETGATVE